MTGIDIGGNMYNILVVDDTEINLLMAERLLVGMPVSVDTATGGEMALAFLRDKRYSVCFFDYQMPDMSGVELLGALRAMDSDNSDVPVVAMTGTEDKNAAGFFLDLGFDAFLDKPLKKDSFFRKLYEITDDPVFDESGYVVTEDELKKLPEGIVAISGLDVRTGL